MSGFLGALGVDLSGEEMGLGLEAAGFVLDGGGNWRARLRRARFRGASFFVAEMGGEYGRRIANHEYPGRDMPYAEDLGRKQRRWTFTGYVLGSLYTLERDRLIAATEKAGPATLIHPTIGIVSASCETCTFNERRETGGYCEFALTFVESGKRMTPLSTVDTIAALAQEALALGSMAMGVFNSVFNMLGMAGQPARSAAADVGKLCDTFDLLRLPVYGVTQGPLENQITALRRDAPALIYQPDQLSTRTSQVFETFTDANEAERATTAHLEIATLFTAHDAGTTGTPATLQEQSNAQSWQRFVRQLALRDAAYSMPGMSLVSTDQAEQVRDAMSAAFIAQEDAAADAGQDDVFAALGDLRIAVLQDLVAREAGLPSLVPYQTPRSLNALTLAWGLYQDAYRDLDVVERVHCLSPAFMPITGKVLNR